jgi:RNA polymerase sigma-F factor
LPVNSIEENVYSSDKDGNELNILDTLKSNKDEANLITNKIVLNKIINSLEKRDKEIILLRYYKDKTQSEVGKILGISQVQVSRIEKRILEKMKKELA